MIRSFFLIPFLGCWLKKVGGGGGGGGGVFGVRSTN